MDFADEINGKELQSEYDQNHVLRITHLMENVERSGMISSVLACTRWGLRITNKIQRRRHGDSASNDGIGALSDAIFEAQGIDASTNETRKNQ